MAQETTKAVVDQATDISAGSTVPRISLSSEGKQTAHEDADHSAQQHTA